MEKQNQLSIVQQKFELVFKSAENMAIVQSAGAAFEAVQIVTSLREILTNEVMKSVFMPLMNTKVGFLTDRSGKADKNGQLKPLYDVDVVRNCIIDAIGFGLLPTFNQFNIIAERMYPTKEGYTARLKQIGCKYFINVGFDKNTNQQFAEIPCTINYEYGNEKKAFQIVATVKKDSYSSPDQLKGKAERRAKKALFEYITGCDFGEADEESSKVIDISSKQSIEPKKAREKYNSVKEVEEDLLSGAISKDKAEELKFNFAVNEK